MITYFFDMRSVKGEVEPERPQVDLPLFYLIQDEPIVDEAQAGQLSHI